MTYVACDWPVRDTWLGSLVIILSFWLSRPISWLEASRWNKVQLISYCCTSESYLTKLDTCINNKSSKINQCIITMLYWYDNSKTRNNYFHAPSDNISSWIPGLLCQVSGAPSGGVGSHPDIPTQRGWWGKSQGLTCALNFLSPLHKLLQMLHMCNSRSNKLLGPYNALHLGSYPTLRQNSLHNNSMTSNVFFLFLWFVCQESITFKIWTKWLHNSLAPALKHECSILLLL